MFLQYGFLYLILTGRKFAVHVLPMDMSVLQQTMAPGRVCSTADCTVPGHVCWKAPVMCLGLERLFIHLLSGEVSGYNSLSSA